MNALITIMEEIIMKKTLALVLVVVMLSATLVACGGNSIIGSWEATVEGVSMKLTFEEDGKGSITTMGVTADMTWSAEGDKLNASMAVMGITEEVFKDATYSVDGDSLSITMEGETVVFKSVD